MNTVLRMLIGFAISVLLPVSALAHDVMYDYDHTQDFSRLRTYALKDFTKSDNPLVDARIESAIAAELAARGLTRDDTDPDVYVTARQAFDTHQEYRTYDSGYGIPYGPSRRLGVERELGLLRLSRGSWRIYGRRRQEHHHANPDDRTHGSRDRQADVARRRHAEGAFDVEAGARHEKNQRRGRGHLRQLSTETPVT